MRSRDALFTRSEYYQLVYAALGGGSHCMGDGMAAWSSTAQHHDVIGIDPAAGEAAAGEHGLVAGDVLQVPPCILKPQPLWSGKQARDGDAAWLIRGAARLC